MFEFAYPKFFWLFTLLIPYILYELFIKDKHRIKIIFPGTEKLSELSKGNSIMLYVPMIVRLIIISLMILALARPRMVDKKKLITGKGIDIILTIDVSGSMQAIDFRPKNRLESAKNVAKQFIENRKNDRIGLVTFAEYAFTQCPLTLDYNILMNILDNVKIDEEASGTAIGMGLATAVARLKDSKAKSKVIILITDGRNNTGEVDPFSAAQYAKTYGIKVYAIGVGKEGYADFPIKTAFGTVQYRKIKSDLDMKTLNKIAAITGTKRAYRARNTKELENIMKEIDRMEKSKIEIKNYYEYKEIFWNFLLAAFILMLIDFLFRTIIRKGLI
jgi:Ca-activated chloride channel family protein